MRAASVLSQRQFLQTGVSQPQHFSPTHKAGKQLHCCASVNFRRLVFLSRFIHVRCSQSVLPARAAGCEGGPTLSGQEDMSKDSPVSFTEACTDIIASFFAVAFTFIF